MDIYSRMKRRALHVFFYALCWKMHTGIICGKSFSKICHSPAAYVSVLSIVHKDTVILHFFYMGKIYKHTSVCDIKVRLRELILPKSKWLDTVIDTIQSVYNRVSFFWFDKNICFFSLACSLPVNGIRWISRSLPALLTLRSLLEYMVDRHSPVIFINYTM